MKKLSCYLRTIFLLAVLITLSGIEVRGEENPVHITMEESERPQIGKKLSASVDNAQGEQYHYIWTVGGYVVSTEQDYTPTVEDCEKWIEVKVFQGSGTEQVVGQDKLLFSKLPVVYIQTDDGNFIYDKTDYTTASMNIQGNQNYGSQYKESNRIQIKVRGNASSKYPQRPYKIKLDKKSNLFGMGKNKHWVLLSNFLDECCLRNVTASKLAKQLGADAMDMQWVDVVFNGKYTGTYILSEHIRVDKNRIDIKDWENIAEEAASQIYKANKSSLEAEDESLLETYMKENLGWITTNKVTYKEVTYQVSDYYSDYWKDCSDISNGYLVELSKEYDEVSRFKTKSGMEVMLQAPEYLCTNSEMFNYVKQVFANYEEAASSVNGFNAAGQSLYELADLDSMVRYWLVMEIIGNNDAIIKSRFAYLDATNKLTFGPVWDFDWGSASRAICEVGEDVSNGWIVSSGSLWKDWVDDPYFLTKAREKYWENHQYLEQLVEENGIIETDYRYVKESGNALYQYIVNSGWGNWSKLVGRPSRGFEEDYAMYYQFMKNRIKWLDEQFKDVDTLVASLSECGTNQFPKSEDTKVYVNNQLASSEMNIVLHSSVGIQLNNQSVNMNQMEVFINGTRVGVFPVKNGVCNISIPKDSFLQDSNEKKVISFIGYNDTSAVMRDYIVASVEEAPEESSVIQETTTNQQEVTTVSQKEVTQKKKAKKNLKAVVIKKCRKKKSRLQLRLTKVKGAKGYTVYVYRNRKNAVKKKKREVHYGKTTRYLWD